MSLRLLLLLAIVSLGGCSVIRGAAFHQIVLAHTPVPPNGTRTEIANYPFLTFGYPGIRITVESPENAESVLAFYRGVFRDKGWQELAKSRDMGPPQKSNDATSGQEEYFFERKSYIGKWSYAREEIELVVWDYRLLRHETQEKSVASVHFVGHYAWDIPGTVAAKGLASLPGSVLPWIGLVVGIPF